jgi:hypothetical protein
MPSVIVADGMSRKVVVHNMAAASAARKNVVCLPSCALNSATADVATTSCLSQHLSALRPCKRGPENTFFATRINSVTALRVKLAQYFGEGTSIRENLICWHVTISRGDCCRARMSHCAASQASSTSTTSLTSQGGGGGGTQMASRRSAMQSARAIHTVPNLAKLE